MLIGLVAEEGEGEEEEERESHSKVGTLLGPTINCCDLCSLILDSPGIGCLVKCQLKYLGYLAAITQNN